VIEAVIRDSIVLGSTVLESNNSKSVHNIARELYLSVSSQVEDKKLRKEILQNIRKISKGV
jgi:hypothetical protein